MVMYLWQRISLWSYWPSGSDGQFKNFWSLSQEQYAEYQYNTDRSYHEKEIGRNIAIRFESLDVATFAALADAATHPCVPLKFGTGF